MSNARCRAERCLQKNIPAPIETESHLCASQVTESACSMPARCVLSEEPMLRSLPGGVNVEPKTVFPCDCCDITQWIDGTTPVVRPSLRS